MTGIEIHPHALRHGLFEDDVRCAWCNFVRMQHRKSPKESQVVAVGYDRSGRLIQMVGVEKDFGILVYHAMTPPTTKVLVELGLVRK